MSTEQGDVEVIRAALLDGSVGGDIRKADYECASVALDRLVAERDEWERIATSQHKVRSTFHDAVVRAENAERTVEQRELGMREQMERAEKAERALTEARKALREFRASGTASDFAHLCAALRSSEASDE